MISIQAALAGDAERLQVLLDGIVGSDNEDGGASMVPAGPQFAAEGSKDTESPNGPMGHGNKQKGGGDPSGRHNPAQALYNFLHAPCPLSG